MKIGCCLNMVAGGRDGTGIEKIEKLAEYGYDYAELPMAEITALSDGDFAELLRRAKASGIPCGACNNFFPKTLRLTGPDADGKEIMAYVEKALSRANALGSGIVVFGSGKAKNVPEGFPMEEGYRQVTELLRKCDPVAAKYGVVIVIEPLRRAECNLINTFAEGCRLADDVGAEYRNIGVLVDYYHLAEENEPPEDLVKYGTGRIRHVHFACRKGRVFPKDVGEDDYLPFIRALRGAGYDGRVSVEAYAEDFDRQAPEALRFMRENF